MQIESEKITYRKLTSHDANILVDCRILYLKETQGDQPSDKELQLRNKLTEYFKKTLSENTLIAWIAEYNKQPIGFGGMAIHYNPGSFDMINGKEGYILNMYTLPDYRKNGICSEILERLVMEGKELDLSRIYLHASDDGIKLYRGYGFAESDMPELELKELNNK
jgi:ribosomal protein S18 acetylase RimI-like enzyme